MTRADEFHQVSPDLFVWEAYDPEVKCELTSTAWRVDGRLVFIDPIALAPEALAELVDTGEPALIVCTNENHARAGDWYRQRFGLPLVAHHAAADSLETKADGWLGEGEHLENWLPGAGIEVIPLPGALAGEIALLRQKVLSVGDALIHLPSRGLEILPAKYCSDAKLLRGSLRKLLRCEFEILTFAHGLPVTVQASRRLSALLD